MRTEIVIFEDNMLYHPQVGTTDLVYRTEGIPQIARTAGDLWFQGYGGFVHAAQLRDATLRIRLAIAAGEPEIAFAHNGLFDNTGLLNPTPGFKIVFKSNATNLVDLATNTILASLKEVVPRSQTEFTIGISWNVDTKVLRLDLPGGSYSTNLPNIPEGGFALRSSRADTSYHVKKISVVHGDNRRIVLYDEYDTLYNLDGTVLTRLQPAKLDPGTYVQVVLVDIMRAKALIFYGFPNNTPMLNGSDPSTIRGFAVRDLATGDIDPLGKPVNGCMPQQGASGIDGRGLVQAWITPSSLCWVDWNAYDRHDLVNFIKPWQDHQAIGLPNSIKPEGPFVGFHDPDSAPDGSMVRYLRITEDYQGQTHFEVHPNIAKFASFSEMTLPQSLNRQSQSGPGVLPYGLVVRDMDRSWYETFALVPGMSQIHTGIGGHNLFSNTTDWLGPQFSSSPQGVSYFDWTNMVPSLTDPGKLYAPYVKFDPTWNNTIPAKAPTEFQSLQYLSLGANTYKVERSVQVRIPIPEHAPIQILWP